MIANYKLVSRNDSKIIHKNCGLPKTNRDKAELVDLLYYIKTNKVRAGFKRIMRTK